MQRFLYACISFLYMTNYSIGKHFLYMHASPFSIYKMEMHAYTKRIFLGYSIMVGVKNGEQLIKEYSFGSPRKVSNLCTESHGVTSEWSFYFISYSCCAWSAALHFTKNQFKCSSVLFRDVNLSELIQLSHSNSLTIIEKETKYVPHRMYVILLTYRLVLLSVFWAWSMFHFQ